MYPGYNSLSNNLMYSGPGSNHGYSSSAPMPGYNGVGVGGYPMAPPPGYNPPPPYNQPPPSYNSPYPPPPPPPNYNNPPPLYPSEPVYGHGPYGTNPPIGQPYGMQTGYNQGPEKDCEILHYAMKGLGTDENAIINLVINRNSQQRAEIRRKYIACYGKDLISRLRDELSGNFQDTVIGLFMTPPEYDAYCLYKAMKGAGTNDGVLIEILGTRNNTEIQMIKSVFEKTYGKSLEKWVKSETSFNFKKCLVSLLQANRSMNTVPNPSMCQNDAQILYKAGEGRLGTDEETFIRIFTQRSAAEMEMICKCYQQLRGKSLHHAIDKEFSGDIQKLLHTILDGLLDPSGYFAKRIREAVQGIGTNDSKLVRVIVSRCEVDMPNIKMAYRQLYGRDIVADIRSDTSGDYKKILTYLLTRV